MYRKSIKDEEIVDIFTCQVQTCLVVIFKTIIFLKFPLFFSLFQSFEIFLHTQGSCWHKPGYHGFTPNKNMVQGRFMKLEIKYFILYKRVAHFYFQSMTFNLFTSAYVRFLSPRFAAKRSLLCDVISPWHQKNWQLKYF